MSREAQAVNVVVRDAWGRVLQLRRSPGHHSWPNVWNLPGGGVEPGESLEEAVRREAFAETEYRVQPSGVMLDVFRYGPGVAGPLPVMVYAYPARITGGEPRLDDEHAEGRWVGAGDWMGLECTPSCTSLLRRVFGDGAGPIVV